ncbi:MAG: AsnC family transcriptional regulator [Gemmataceae bacterium]|jgi:Rrf2 family cysteine metabolism transcriptional repressor|nr:MAG: AsnC family transcriptional regulator [Gemmataceae bacterium]
MQPSAKAEYACVAMLELAARYPEKRPIRVADIAQRHNISDRFLVQILLALKYAGLVESVRGAAGGYILSRPPETITLYDILQVTDPTHKVENQDGRSHLSPFFRQLQGVWLRVRQAEEQVLKQITLADLVAQCEGPQYVI